MRASKFSESQKACILMRRTKVAVARKLAVLLLRMWRDGAELRWGKEAAAA